MVRPSAVLRPVLRTEIHMATTPAQREETATRGHVTLVTGLTRPLMRRVPVTQIPEITHTRENTETGLPAVVPLVPIVKVRATVTVPRRPQVIRVA